MTRVGLGPWRGHRGRRRGRGEGSYRVRFPYDRRGAAHDMCVFVFAIADSEAALCRGYLIISVEGYLITSAEGYLSAGGHLTVEGLLCVVHTILHP